MLMVEMACDDFRHNAANVNCECFALDVEEWRNHTLHYHRQFHSRILSLLRRVSVMIKPTFGSSGLSSSSSRNANAEFISNFQHCIVTTYFHHFRVYISILIYIERVKLTNIRLLAPDCQNPRIDCNLLVNILYYSSVQSSLNVLLVAIISM